MTYWDTLDPKIQAGVYLHECFHASFSGFDHDTYTMEKSLSAKNGLTNAESYANFSSIISTGGSTK